MSCVSTLETHENAFNIDAKQESIDNTTTFEMFNISSGGGQEACDSLRSECY